MPESTNYVFGSQMESLFHLISDIFQDELRKMMELQTRLGDADLIQPNRVFIKEGEFSDITKAGREQLLSLFLFSDVLIVTTGKQCHKIQLVAAKVAVSKHLILLCREDCSR